MKLKDILTGNWRILKKSFGGWNEDKAMTLSAALAYYTIFSIAPLLVITVAVAGLFFGHEASTGEIFSSIRGLVGDEGARSIQEMVQASAVKDKSILATVIGVATLLIGATTVFGQLQDSLNQIWKVKPRPGRGIWTMIRQRLLSFSLILVIGFLLLTSLVLSAALAGVGKFAEENLPGGATLWQGVNFALSFAIITALFAAMYKILPDVRLAWREVWTGAAVTALFFSIGKFLIGLYLGRSSITSTYGAAGSGVVILVWTYYSGAILFLGAEYTKFRALSRSRPIPLKEGAEWIDVSPLQKDAKLETPASPRGPGITPKPAYT